MTRAEEILKAARDYVDGVISSSPSDVIHFENGAKWADEHPNLESLWHDASEEPLLEDKEIIFLTEQGVPYISESFGGTFSYMLEDSYWKRYVNLLRISKWAYISDLFPKQFGNSEQLKGGRYDNNS